MKKFFVVLLSFIMALSVSLFSFGCENDPQRPDKNDPNHPPKPTFFYYSDYGAVGDGVTDDFDAIIKTHEEANKLGAAKGAIVRAVHPENRIGKDDCPNCNGEIKPDCLECGPIFYIGGAQKTVTVKTDTDWTGAKFLIDDTKVEFETRPLVVNGSARPGFNERVWKDSWIFNIAPTLDPYELSESERNSMLPFKKGQETINLQLDYDAVIIATDSSTLRYRRRGENANNGDSQQDVFVIDKSGNVDVNAPIMWDFDNLSRVQVFPIDERTLNVTGGHFITKNNLGNADDVYMKRGIHITRSNTVIDGLTRDIIEERIPRSNNSNDLLFGGAAYRGFIQFDNCANVTLKNSTLCGHRGYRRPSATGTTRGSYDIEAFRTANLSVINCDQKRNITDGTYWGIFASNFSKNILFDGVKFSRFDAHMGVHNTKILNSELGHQGCSIIGSGLLLIENTKITGTNFIYFRDDYGSTWEGELVIKDCTFVPGSNASVIHTNNDGQHNFYYPAFMPETVTIENLTVQDGNAAQGVLLFRITNQNTNAPYLFIWTKTLNISGFQSQSGRAYRIDNTSFLNQLTINN